MNNTPKLILLTGASRLLGRSNCTLKRFGIGLFCLFSILIPRTILAQADKIYEKNNKAVVVILTYDKKDKPLAQGSGFIVRSDGAIVTNLHVVSKAVSIKVKIAKDEYLEVEGVLYTDKANDLVILKAKGEDLPVLKLGSSDKIKPGEKVYVIGSPAGLENTISDGIISGIREISRDQKVIQISAPVSQGSSGGPVFNEKGEVIGIATFGLKDAQNLNFAMPVNLIKDKISNKEIIKIPSFDNATIPDITKQAEYWFWQGYYLQEAGKHKEAIESYKEAIRIKPDYAEAHYNLGVTYGKLGDKQKEIECYKQAIRIKPDYANAHFNLGVAYADMKDYRKAIDSYKQAIKLKPNLVLAHCYLGSTYYRLGFYKEAIDSFKQAIKSDPKNALAYYYLGNTYDKTEDYRGARDAYRKSIQLKLDEDFLPEAYYLIGYACKRLNDDSGAIQSFKKTTELKIDHADAWEQLGDCYLRTKQRIKGKYKESVDAYIKAITIRPDEEIRNSYIHFKLGLNYILLRNLDKALSEKVEIQGLHNKLIHGIPVKSSTYPPTFTSGTTQWMMDKLGLYMYGGTDNPGIGATDVSITPQLSWTAASGATSYKVYFGTRNPPPYRTKTTATTYIPGRLSYGTTYYWRIDPKNSAGTTHGTVWSFTTCKKLLQFIRDWASDKYK